LDLIAKICHLQRRRVLRPEDVGHEQLHDPEADGEERHVVAGAEEGKVVLGPALQRRGNQGEVACGKTRKMRENTGNAEKRGKCGKTRKMRENTGNAEKRGKMKKNAEKGRKRKKRMFTCGDSRRM
jgi:hypothetical protein